MESIRKIERFSYMEIFPDIPRFSLHFYPLYYRPYIRFVYLRRFRFAGSGVFNFLNDGGIR